jgi:hypothetical protein
MPAIGRNEETSSGTNTPTLVAAFRAYLIRFSLQLCPLPRQLQRSDGFGVLRFLHRLTLLLVASCDCSMSNSDRQSLISGYVRTVLLSATSLLMNR